MAKRRKTETRFTVGEPPTALAYAAVRAMTAQPGFGVHEGTRFPLVLRIKLHGFKLPSQNHIPATRGAAYMKTKVRNGAFRELLSAVFRYGYLPVFRGGTFDVRFIQHLAPKVAVYDCNNLYTKAALDCLCLHRHTYDSPRKKAKSVDVSVQGLGIVEDDSPSHMTSETKSVVPKSPEGTMLEIVLTLRAVPGKPKPTLFLHPVIGEVGPDHIHTPNARSPITITHAPWSEYP